MLSRRGFVGSLLGSAAGAGLVPLGLPRLARAADKPSEIRIDWATYNPVSMVLKQNGLLEKEFAKDGIGVRWVQSLGSNKALEFLNAGSIDFGSTAGSAALLSKINGNPIKSIYVYSRPEWTALVTRKDTAINKIEDLKGKRVAVTRGTDPHIFLVRALQSAGLSEKDIVPVLLQHPDGKIALDPRRRRRLGRSRSDDGGSAGRGRRAAVLSQQGGQYLRHPQWQRGLPQQISGPRPSACSASTRMRANIASPITTTRRRCSWM